MEEPFIHEFRDGDPILVYDMPGIPDGTVGTIRLVEMFGITWPQVEVESLAFCPTCGSLSCPNVKNAAAMCPGAAP